MYVLYKYDLMLGPDLTCSALPEEGNLASRS